MREFGRASEAIPCFLLTRQMQKEQPARRSWRDSPSPCLIPANPGLGYPVQNHFFLKSAAAAAKSDQSCLTLCDPIDGRPPGSPVPGILQARTLEGCRFLLQCMKLKSESEVAQSCLTLRDPMDYSLPGSSAHGISQARVLEWVTIAFSPEA